jgi:hypothetical protein
VGAELLSFSLQSLVGEIRTKQASKKKKSHLVFGNVDEGQTHRRITRRQKEITVVAKKQATQTKERTPDNAHKKDLLV